MKRLSKKYSHIISTIISTSIFVISALLSFYFVVSSVSVLHETCLYPSVSMDWVIYMTMLSTVLSFISVILLFLGFFIHSKSKRFNIIGTLFMCASLIVFECNNIGTIGILSVIAGLICVATICSAIFFKHLKKWILVLIVWISYVVSLVAFVIIVFCLCVDISVSGQSHTTDIENYLIFDQTVNEQAIFDFFPTTDSVLSHSQNGNTVLYSYTESRGLFGRASEYDISIELTYVTKDGFDTEKARLLNMSNIRTETQDNCTLIVVNDNTLTDTTGSHYYDLHYVKIDNLNQTIFFSATRSYREPTCSE